MNKKKRLMGPQREREREKRVLNMVFNLSKAKKFDENIERTYIFAVAVWRLWFWRNQAIFLNNYSSTRNIILDINSRAAEIQRINFSEIRMGATRINKYLH